METLRALIEPERHRAARNLLVGLAMDEHRAGFKRGDFLFPSSWAVDPSSSAIAHGADPRVGRTL